MQNSAVAFRRLGSRQTIAGDPNFSLVAINTTPLDDGAVCWVIDENTDYRLVRSATNVPDGFNIVVPGSGPGRWFRVSGASAAEIDILQAKRSGTDQAGVGAGTDVLLNNTVFVRGTGISHNIITGVFTLAALRNYELDAWGYVLDFSDATSGELVMEWVDANTNVPITSSIPGIFHPTSNTNNDGDSPRVAAMFISLGPAQLKLRVTAATGTAAISTAFGAIIKQLR